MTGTEEEKVSLGIYNQIAGVALPINTQEPGTDNVKKGKSRNSQQCILLRIVTTRVFLREALII
jgi:hypothetical protein